MKFLEFLAQHGYCEGLMIITALIAFVFSLKHYGRHRGLRIIPYYIGFFILQAMFVEFYWYASPKGRFAYSIEETGTSAFNVFEVFAFSLLILQSITGPGRRLAIKLNVVLFFVGEVLFYMRSSPPIPNLQMCLLEPAALVLPVVLYFYELFTVVNAKSLKDRPSFWIVSGILYLSVVSVISMLSVRFLGRFGDSAYALGNIFYSLLFLLWMRAYQCHSDEWVVA